MDEFSPSVILFDVDGVLTDSHTWHDRALEEALHDYYFNHPPPLHGPSAWDAIKAHYTQLDGRPTKEKLRFAGLDEEQVEAVYQRKLERMPYVIAEQCRPDHQKTRLLWELRQAGYFIGCVSNAHSDTVFMMLDMAHLLPYVGLVIGNDMVMKNKPDPECYLTAMDAIDYAEPSNVIVVEDSLCGVEAAAKAGIQRILHVTYKNVTVETFRKEGILI